MNDVKIGLVIWGLKNGLEKLLSTVPDYLSKIKEDPYRDARSIFHGFPYFSNNGQPPLIISRLPEFRYTCVSYYWNATDDVRRSGFVVISILIPNSLAFTGQAMLDLLKRLSQVYFDNAPTNTTGAAFNYFPDAHIFRPIIDKVEASFNSVNSQISPTNTTQKASMFYDSEEQLASLFSNLNEDELTLYQQLYLLPSGGNTSLSIDVPRKDIPRVSKRYNLKIEFIDSKRQQPLYGVFLTYEKNGENIITNQEVNGKDYTLNRISEDDNISLTIMSSGYQKKVVDSWRISGQLKTDKPLIVELNVEEIYKVNFNFVDSTDEQNSMITGVNYYIRKNGNEGKTIKGSQGGLLDEIKKEDYIEIIAWNNFYNQVIYSIPINELSRNGKFGEYIPVNIPLTKIKTPQEGNIGRNENSEGGGDANGSDNPNRDSGNNDNKVSTKKSLLGDNFMTVVLPLLAVGFVVLMVSFFLINDWFSNPNPNLRTDNSYSDLPQTLPQTQSKEDLIPKNKIDSTIEMFYTSIKSYNENRQDKPRVRILEAIKSYKKIDSLLTLGQANGKLSEYGPRRDQVLNNLNNTFLSKLEDEKITYSNLEKRLVQYNTPNSDLAWFLKNSIYNDSVNRIFKNDLATIIDIKSSQGRNVGKNVESNKSKAEKKKTPPVTPKTTTDDVAGNDKIETATSGGNIGNNSQETAKTNTNSTFELKKVETLEDAVAQKNDAAEELKINPKNKDLKKYHIYCGVAQQVFAATCPINSERSKSLQKSINDLTVRDGLKSALTTELKNKCLNN